MRQAVIHLNACVNGSTRPKYGYFPKPSKCILVVKPDRLEHANAIFKGTGVKLQVDGAKDSGVEINTTGTRHLGAAVGQRIQGHVIRRLMDG